MSRTNLFIAVAFVLTLSAPTALAQRGGTGGGMSGGMGGMSSGLGGMSGGMGMSGMNGGRGGFGSGMGSGMGGFGGGMGMGGMGGGMGGFGTSGMGGSGFGQSSMGMNQQGGQAFVGRDTADMTSIFNELGRNSNQFMQQLNRTMGRGNRGNRNQTQEQNVVLPVRVRLDVAFDHYPISPTAVATRVRSRLEKLLTHRNIAAPDVELVGDTVVLRGVAPSESERLVIENLVMLEPGVLGVDNQMTVAQQPLTPPLPPQADN